MSLRRSSPTTISLKRLRSRRIANRTRLAQEVNQTHTTEVVLPLLGRPLLNTLLLHRPMVPLQDSTLRTAPLQDNNLHMVHHLANRLRMVHQQVSPLHTAHLMVSLRLTVHLKHRHHTVPLLNSSMERHNNPMELPKVTTTVVHLPHHPSVNLLAHLSARLVGTLSTTRTLNVGTM